jgi:hypothetical protein
MLVWYGKVFSLCSAQQSAAGHQAQSLAQSQAQLRL